MSFGGGGYGQDLEAEQRSMLGTARDLARGLAHPVPAFFHLLFKVSAALAARCRPRLRSPTRAASLRARARARAALPPRPGGAR